MGKRNGDGDRDSKLTAATSNMARGLRQGVNNKESPVSSTVATVFERAAISGDDTTLVLGGLAEIVVAEQEEAS
ncbi:unnamed protein product [Phytophthora fragariaefolia]|uniref:Unnamed protein product n=1 Tax=Phytophthora fragariaefolia TaxID=1490495 RepID=A0A9W6YB62_9STRA|nr:unnamed protein product [Phytophthora fragariaefolia]